MFEIYIFMRVWKVDNVCLLWFVVRLVLFMCLIRGIIYLIVLRKDMFVGISILDFFFVFVNCYLCFIS